VAGSAQSAQQGGADVAAGAGDDDPHGIRMPAWLARNRRIRIEPLVKR
jgi:hypothetical protein